MNGRIIVDEEKCVGCNKCIRNCIVFDANFARVVGKENKVAVNPDKCVLCGKCIEVCDHEARDFTDDTEVFFEDLQKGDKISVIAAPAIRANFEKYENLFGLLKSKGVDVIYDVSFGADITTWAYLKAIKEFNLKPFQVHNTGGRHSFMVSSAPTILRPRVRITSTPSVLFFNLH